MKTDSKAAKFEGVNISRRSLLTAAAAAAFTIVPSRVLAGPGKIAPNNKINLGCIGAD